MKIGIMEFELTVLRQTVLGW